MNVVVSITPLLQNEKAVVSLEIMKISAEVKSTLIQFCDDLAHYRINHELLRCSVLSLEVAYNFQRAGENYQGSC